MFAVCNALQFLNARTPIFLAFDMSDLFNAIQLSNVSSPIVITLRIYSIL